ncbi:hypothetical protein HA466_0239480 [Hirschfeldia incana]|nr:hypothetical protein HA466_0239480 [Hirschfeldia incana]
MYLTCGPGPGISICSLGNDGTKVYASNITNNARGGDAQHEDRRQDMTRRLRIYLIRCDRTLLVVAQRRCEPKKFGGCGAFSCSQ